MKIIGVEVGGSAAYFHSYLNTKKTMAERSRGPDYTSNSQIEKAKI